MDLWRFAREGGSLEGAIALAELSRLEDWLFDTKGEVFFRIQGEMARPDALDGQKARLSVVVSGELPLICQRCLSAVRVKIAIDNRLELVDDEQSAPTSEELEGEELDFLPVASGKTGFRSAEELVEDEILLTLPSSPRHDDCNLPEREKIEAPHPFSALAALKGRVTN